MYITVLLLSMSLFVCHFVPPCEVSEGTVRISACVSSYFTYLSTFVSLNIYLHVVSMISITTTLVKLLQMI